MKEWRLAALKSLWRDKLLTDSNLGLASNYMPVRKCQQKGYVHIIVAKL